MAVKTQQQLTDEIALNLASASNITASEHRQVAQDIVDTLFSLGRTYKIYSALITQGLTDPPVATVLENTLGGEIIWTYDSIGVYIGTLAGAFTEGKTMVQINNGDRTGNNAYWDWIDADNISINTWNVATTAGADGAIRDGFLEIRIYP